MTRDPGKVRFPRSVETVHGDLTDPAGLAPVLAGVDRMYLFPVARTAKQVADLARQAGVRRVVVLSSAAVTSGADRTVHPPVEQAAEQAATEWTHVRPGEFMLNRLLLWGPSIRAEGVVYYPGRVRLHRCGTRRRVIRVGRRISASAPIQARYVRVRRLRGVSVVMDPGTPETADRFPAAFQRRLVDPARRALVEERGHALLGRRALRGIGHDLRGQPVRLVLGKRDLLVQGRLAEALGRAAAARRP